MIIPLAIAAYQGYQQSSQEKDKGEYQAKVAKNNEVVANMQAEDAKERGDVAAAGVRRKYAAMEGTQAASLAARGLDISEGSANAILTDTNFFGDYDQRTARKNAEREAWGFRVRAGNFAGDAGAYQAGADAENPMLSGALAGTQSYFKGGGKTGLAQPAGLPDGSSLLSSGTSVSPKWYGSVNGSAGSGSFDNWG